MTLLVIVRSFLMHAGSLSIKLMHSIFNLIKSVFVTLPFSNIHNLPSHRPVRALTSRGSFPNLMGSMPICVRGSFPNLMGSMPISVRGSFPNLIGSMPISVRGSFANLMGSMPISVRGYFPNHMRSLPNPIKSVIGT